MTAVATQAAPGMVQWDQELRGAQYLLKSGLVPADIKTPEAALFIILTGRDIGVSAVQSLRSIRVIKGKVEVSADLQLGKFHSNGGRSRFITLTNEAAKLELTAPWLTAPHVESFTMDDAKTAGLTSNDTYRKYPKAMLRSRAITAGLKSIGFDATAGMYAPGEVGGEVQVIGEQVVGAEIVVEAEEGPTRDQYVELDAIAADAVWSEKEAADLRKRAEKTTTMDRMAALIEKAGSVVAERKAKLAGAGAS